MFIEINLRLYKMRKILDGLNGRIDIVEEKSCDLADIAIETICNKTEKRFS